MNESAIISSLTKAEQDAQTIRQRDEQIKRLQAELDEYIKVEKIMIAARLINEQKFLEAHDLVRSWS